MTTKTLKRLVGVFLMLAMLGIPAFCRQQVAVGQTHIDKDEAPQAGEKAKDLSGDPLPAGAKARMGTLRWRHPASVTYLGIASKQKQVVTACSDGYIRVWDLASGKEIRRFGGPTPRGVNGGGGIMVQPGGGMVAWGGGLGTSVVLSPDGAIVAASEGSGKITLWEVSSGKKLRSVGREPNKNIQGFIAFPAGDANVAFSPEGKMLAIREGDQTITLWDAANGKEMRTIGKKPQPQPGGGVMIVGGLGGPLVFLPDGKSIATIGMEIEKQMPVNVIRILDVDNGKERNQIRITQNLIGAGTMAVAPQGKTLAWASGDGQVHIHDIASGKETATLAKQPAGSFIHTLVYSPSGKVLATQSTKNQIQLWDVASGKELRKIGAPAADNGLNVIFSPFGASATIAFSADGKTIAEASAGNTVRIWNAETGKEVAPATGHSGGVSQVSVSADGKTLTTTAPDRTIRQWKMATGEQVRHLKLPAAAAEVALSADGKLAAWSNGAAITLWDVAAAKEARTIDLPGLKQQGGLVLAGLSTLPVLSADGKLVASRAFDQSICIFDTQTGKELRHLNEQPANANGGFMGGFGGFGGFGLQTPMAFSPDGTRFSAGRGIGGPVAFGLGGNPMQPGGGLQWWTLSKGSKPRKFDAKRDVVALAVSPDNRTIATANSDNTISLWEALTGKECLEIKLDKNEKKAKQPQPGNPGGMIWQLNRFGATSINCLAISPDGRTLAAGDERTIRLWDLRTGKELGKFTGHEGTIQSLAFAADNQTIVSGSSDTTALVWDGGRFIKKDPGPIELKAEAVDALWKDLAADPVKAYKAIDALSRAPKQAVALFAEQIKPTAGIDAKQVEQWIADLGSNKFAIRKKATSDLEKLGELAQPALQKALAKQPTLEAQARLEKLLALIANDDSVLPETQRALRAVLVLERLNSAEARSVLQSLAHGAPGAKLTRHAGEALKRMGGS